MNYTKNYHLPQWVKEDRIMMDDFNQMCADLEAGMTENAQGSAEAKQGTSALDQKTLSRLRRLAYNHYCTVQDMDPFPWQVGVFHQNPAKDGSGVTGTSLWNGVCFAAQNPADMTLGGIGDYMEEAAQMNLVKNNLAACTPLKVNVCVPANAYMTRIDLSGNIRDNVPNTPAPAKLTLLNLDTGAVEVTQMLDIGQDFEFAGLANGFINCFLAFHAGQHYQLQLEALAAVYNADLHLRHSDQTPLIPVYNDCAITAVHTIREHEGSSGGLVIVRGMVFGEGLTVKWDGQLIPLHSTRTVRIPDGRWVREMAYFRSTPISAETTISLHYDNSVPGSFLFYDWGAVLL